MALLRELDELRETERALGPRRAPIARVGRDRAERGSHHVRPDPPVRDPLVRLAELRSSEADLAARFRLLVGEARSAGHSWAQIGRSLGVSKQAAQKRFGRARRP